MEEAENDEHLENCRARDCRHQAHLFKAVADRYGESAEVFEFVAVSKDDYENRLRHNELRRYEEVPYVSLRKQEARSLVIIRRGWNRLYGSDEDEHHLP